MNLIQSSSSNVILLPLKAWMPLCSAFLFLLASHDGCNFSDEAGACLEVADEKILSLLDYISRAPIYSHTFIFFKHVHQFFKNNKKAHT